MGNSVLASSKRHVSDLYMCRANKDVAGALDGSPSGRFDFKKLVLKVDCHPPPIGVRY